MQSDAFSTLPLSSDLLGNLESLGYQSMTPIQQQSLPRILDGQDLIAKAKTGSGKTAAFALGILNGINLRDFACQALVICPTRELATQVANEFRRLARPLPNLKVLTLCGGVAIGPQIASLEHGAHVVVGTPGRIDDHLRKRTLSLERMRTLVLDEADRMLDMGFFDAIEGIIRQTPAQRQTLLFSATYPEQIRQLSANFQRNPVEVSVESLHSHAQIQQLFYAVAKPTDKVEGLRRIFGHYQPESCIVFCKTKQGCNELSETLRGAGYSAVALHGDMEQKERDQVLVKFSNQSVSILIATDVAARGLDISDLQAVVNFDIPTDSEVYVHRIGRTGRAGKSGLAITLLTEGEHFRLEELGHFLEQKFATSSVTELTDSAAPAQPPMVTLSLDGGKKTKLRAGDILGALTGDAGIPGTEIGKINIYDFVSYVAITRKCAKEALNRLQNGKIKGRKVRVRKV